MIEELRIWKVVRTAQQIREGMESDDGRGPGERDSGWWMWEGMEVDQGRGPGERLADG